MVTSLLGRPAAPVLMKQTDRLDRETVDVLRHSPIAGLGYQDADGFRHCTFVGGEAGFLEVLSPRQIGLPMPVTAPDPHVGSGLSLVVLLPGVSEVLLAVHHLAANSATRSGRLIRLLTAPLVHVPGLVGALMAWLFRSALAKEGYDTRAGSGTRDRRGPSRW